MSYREIVCALVAFPAACVASPWVIWHAWKIRRRGRELTAEELRIADSLGMKDSDEVRVLTIGEIPNPLRGPGAAAELAFGRSLLMKIDGITLDRSIYVRDEHAESVALLAHEMVHVRQYEQHGGVFRFLYQYIRECLTFGYHYAPMEVEARRLSREVIRVANQ